LRLGVFTGDTQDCARTHYRDHLRGYRADANSQAALDAWSKKDVRDLAKLLKPIRHKIIGAIKGNHLFEFSDGVNTEQYLCQLLDIPYLGPMAAVRLEFRDKAGRMAHQMTLVGHHNGGSNGGGSPGADVTAMKRLENAWDADIYVLSHTHRRGFIKEPILTLSAKGEPRVVERCKVFIRSGAFLKGYKDDFPTVDKFHAPNYAEEKAYRPTDLGWVTANIKLTHVGGNGDGHGSVKQDITLSY